MLYDVVRDRRFYSRINLGLPAEIYFENGREINCMVTDISESGISFFTTEDLSFVQPKTIIKFQTMDIFKYFKDVVKEYPVGSAIVIRVKKKKQGWSMGCKFNTNLRSLEEYVQKKKVALFLQEHAMHFYER